MNQEEIDRARHTPGGTQTDSECSCTAWYVDNKTGEVTPLGVVSYGSKSPFKRLAYRVMRRMGRI